ncbi:MAG TPA: class I SAM-dependent methyltransferase [Propionibacteriaceae bacterium]|nr:class I SAM-dependent methyltransferase [Propionibacteriaceae bacterium]
MNLDAVRALVSPVGAEALTLADEQEDPSSLAAAGALRARFPAELAAAALTQAELRRRARTKFGPLARRMLFTRGGLEQATRPAVAAGHAAHLKAVGSRRVADFGCGIGSDAMGFLAAGLEVVAIERDPVTAEIARHNLALISGSTASPSPPPGAFRVVVGDAEELAPAFLDESTAAFCDPARRNVNRRLWRVEDFTPSWSFVLGLLNGARPAGVKLGPALPHALIPTGVHAEWVSHGGDTVEVALWAGTADPDGTSAAVVLPGARVLVDPTAPPLEVVMPRRYLYEPDGAVIRAGAINQVGHRLQAGLLDGQIAYLTSDLLVSTPFARAFVVEEVLPYQERTLRRWLTDHRVGSLEIKQRGIDGDPAALRKRLKPRGPASATFVISRTPHGAQVLVVRRVPAAALDDHTQGHG